MTRPRIAIGFTVLLMIAVAATSPASAQEQTPSTTAPTDAPVKKSGRMDPKHPVHIGVNYYPRKSLRNREQGRCLMVLFIKADGSVPVAQLLKSTGYPLLDTACIEAFIDIPMLPATVNGKSVDSWDDFLIAWRLNPPYPYHPPLEKSAPPRVSAEHELPVGEKFYPEAARAEHPRGYCVVHTIVDPTGAVRDASITHSTGSPVLDKACLDAITPARFTLEQHEGLAVEPTDIAIYW
jgi:TonB family protein